jgi:hypothetical protein
MIGDIGRQGGVEGGKANAWLYLWRESDNKTDELMAVRPLELKGGGMGAVFKGFGEADAHRNRHIEPNKIPEIIFLDIGLKSMIYQISRSLAEPPTWALGCDVA